MSELSHTSASPCRIALVGANGRMGQRVQHLITSSAGFSEPLLLDSDIQSSLSLKNIDVVIDFSAPAACQTWLVRAQAVGASYVLASTGLSVEDFAAVEAASADIAVMQAANLSLGVNVLLELVEHCAAKLAAFDTEILEVHHRYKRDAPSGTALALGAAVMRGNSKIENEVKARVGEQHLRGASELGYSALRGGQVPGEHTVFFFGENERLELTHRAANADIFAEGALRVARWLSKQKPGHYSMKDMLAGL